ncbi:MAG: ABC transporter substrate-binding protein, partial [Myxococcota bacterium]
VISSPGEERQLPQWVKNLKRIGIAARIVRVDPAARQMRRENFDYDMLWVWWSQSATPGAELRSYFGSAAADYAGSFNLAGIKSPVVDELIEMIAHATDRVDFDAAVHALDRVLLWGEYVVPLLHKQTLWILYWNRLSHPRRPKYDSDFPALWWYDDQKAELLGLTRDWEKPALLAGQRAK